MKIIYRIFKFSLIIALFCIIISGLLFNYFLKDNKKIREIRFFEFSGNIVEITKDFFIKNLDENETTLKVEKEIESLKEFLVERLKFFISLKEDKTFVEHLFIYIVSKNPKEFNSYFTESKLTGFKDFIIIDRSQNVIFKYGNTIYPLNFFKLSSEVEIRTIEKDIVFLENYYDKTIDFEIQMVGIIDEKVLTQKLRDSGFPACYILGNKLYKNERFPQSWIKDYEIVKEKKRIYKGMYNLLLVPVTFSNIYIGAIGIVYPGKDMGNFLILILKIILLLIVSFLIFEIDAYFEKKFNKKEIEKKYIIQQKQLKKKKEEENLEADYEKSLEWVGKYIEKLESKR
jgi:hypothetical protein